MKSMLLTAILLFSSLVWADTPSNIYEMDVKGMTCPFCAYGIEKNLNKLPGVKNAQISLEQKKIRVEMKDGHSFDETKVRAVISDSGFTPGEQIIQKSGQ